MSNPYTVWPRRIGLLPLPKKSEKIATRRPPRSGGRKDAPMETYKTFRPTGFDHAGLGLRDQQDWLVAPVTRSRDSDPLTESNFKAFLKALGGESDTVQVCRFGHWACGWFEIVILDPADKLRVAEAEAMADALEAYPVLDDEDFSERESAAAEQVWRDCYNDGERVAYIRKFRNQFDFQSLADLRACVRGEFFGGWASELLA